MLQACYIVCAPGAGAVGGLLASGILKIDSIGSISGWRAIFWVEGIISMGIGLISWFLVQDRPSACKWLTPEERELAEFRLVAENVGQSEAVDKMHSKAVWSGIFNVTTLGERMHQIGVLTCQWEADVASFAVVSLIFLFDNCVVQGTCTLYPSPLVESNADLFLRLRLSGVGFFLPTIIKSIYPGETVIQQQLRTVPTYVVGMATTLATGYLAWKTRRRGLYMLISAPFMVLGFILYLICASSVDSLPLTHS